MSKRGRERNLGDSKNDVRQLKGGGLSDFLNTLQLIAP